MKIVKIKYSIALICFLLVCFCCQSQTKQDSKKQNISNSTTTSISKQTVDTAIVEYHRQVCFYNKKKYVCLDALNEPRLDHEVPIKKKVRGDLLQNYLE